MDYAGYIAVKPLVSLLSKPLLPGGNQGTEGLSITGLKNYPSQLNANIVACQDRNWNKLNNRHIDRGMGLGGSGSNWP